MPANTKQVPQHIAIFMDGNGRWAKARGLARTEGHKEGLKAAKRIVRAAAELGIKYVTLYTFSTENWKRAQEEVSFLMGLVGTYLYAELDFYKELGVKVVCSGNIDGLPKNVQEALNKTKASTQNFTNICVNLAINYGGRDEILRAIAKIPAGKVPKTEAEFEKYLDIPSIPHPDLIIRAGGELRLSNFLLWQAAYSELYFSDVLWPDWTYEHLHNAIDEYQRRDRRFGNTVGNTVGNIVGNIK